MAVREESRVAYRADARGRHSLRDRVLGVFTLCYSITPSLTCLDLTFGDAIMDGSRTCEQ